MNFVKTALKHRQITITILAIVFVAGVYSLLTMPRREDPKLTIPQGLVISYYPGATAAQVEEQVTKKLEHYLFQYEEVYKAKTTSVSRDGLSIVYVWLNDNVDKPEIFWSKLRHQLLVTKQIDLPQGVMGPVVNSDFGDTEALLISVESENASYAELNEYAKLLEDNIRFLKASSKIRRIGEQKEQITVYFDSDKLSQLGIGVQQIVQILQSQNAVSPTGNLKTENNTVSLYTSGFYTDISQIKNQIIGTSKTGEVLRLGDIAELKREYAEPDTYIEINDHKTVIVAVQMNEGNNIVWFGKDVDKIVDEVSRQLPSNVKITTIVNQPEMVDANISHFLKEFMIAIIAVIIVIMLLLPFRIAAVAATTIPMTISITFVILHVFGIELHQVSLISLILVLGLVVDDAIVVSDNYVDLLGRGLSRWEAAWRSASDLVIPIFTATITIIASFLPLLILPGAIGEFLHDLPVTVTIALASSFIVAMVLTPTLCFLFIKKGVHSENEHKNKKSFVLDGMQAGYNKALEWCVNHRAIVIAGSLLFVVAAVAVFKFGIRQQFMPYAERNQFLVEIWMPTGTKLEKTKESVLRVESEIKNDERVVSYASFTGTSAPRVYYNFSPEFPVSNYAQILVNTTSNKDTETLAHELEKKIDELVPEGSAQVRLMQQGQPLKAPVEIYIYGDDVPKLKETSAQIKEIIKSKNGSHLVHDDFREDFYGVSINLKEDASRLGFTTTSVSQMIYAGFKGYPVTAMHEGDKTIDVVLRMNEEKRSATQDLENFYVESPVTGAKVSLRQIAELKPGWQQGNIMHRNGLRCMTVRCDSKDGVLPSEILSEIRPEIAQLDLPNNFKIEYGGEYANQNEVLTPLIGALSISLMLIFLILLIQFRNLKETFIVMLTIPLSVFGAAMGLVIMGNNFGLTAFAGLICLSGIVVRNAIILIDHAKELIDEGMDIQTAAVESGKRRLRPIFLTAMAAAVGVFPMIISGSSLWSPLASVIAFGVIWGMLMALLVVPILYMLMIKPKDTGMYKENLKNKKKIPMGYATIIALVLFVVSTTAVQAQETQKLSLQQMQEMALQNNHYLKVKQMQVNQKEQQVNESKVKFFPSVTANAGYMYNHNLPSLAIEQGSFGELPLQYILPDGSLYNVTVELPDKDYIFEMSEHSTYNAGAMLYQPISQIPKINTGIKIAKNELSITKEEQTKAVMQIKQAVEKLYFGLLILEKQQQEAEMKKQAAQQKLDDVESAILSGKATILAKSGLNAALAGEEQNLLKINIQINDYTADLKHLIGVVDSVHFTLDDNFMSESFLSVQVAHDASKAALDGNADLKIANLTLAKAQNAVKAADYSYLPDVGIFGAYAHQQGNSLFPNNNLLAGVSFKWNIQDAFSNTYTRKQRYWQKKQAEENVLNLEKQLNNELEKSSRRLLQSEELISVAQKVVDYRREDLKVENDKQFTGLGNNTDYLTAKANLAKAEADLYAAQLSYRLALTDLQILTGNY